MPVTFPRLSTRLLSALLIALLAFTFAVKPAAQAETAGQRSTRNIILAGVALTTAIILYNNYHHKQVAHNTVVGYTADGGTVYADGRIVYPNGTVVYTSNNGRTPCTYDGYGTPCGPYAQPYHVANGYDADDQPVYYSNAGERPVSYGDADDQRVYRGDGDDQRVYYRDADNQPVSYRYAGQQRVIYRQAPPVYRYVNAPPRQVYYRDADRDGSRGAAHMNRGHHYGNAKHTHGDGG